MQKKTTDKGASYYVMHFSPQFATTLEMDQITYDSLSHVKNLITAENSRIDEAYKEALMQGDDDAEAARIMEAVDTFDADFV